MFDVRQYPRNEAGESEGGGGGGGSPEDSSAARPSGSDQGAAAAGGATPGGADLFGRTGGAADQGTPAASGDGAQFEFSSLIEKDGSFREGWHNDLVTAKPELSQFSEILSQYKDPVEALKALGHTKSLVGRKLEHTESVLNPNREDPTAMGLYRSTVGIPEKPEGYNYQAPEELAGVVDDDQLSDFRQWAHDHDVPDKLFGELVNYQAAIMGEASQGLEQAIVEADETAQREFWESMDKELGGKHEADKALDQMVRLLRHGGMTDEQIKEIGIHRMGTAAVKALAAIAKNTGEDRLPAGGGQLSQGISAEEQYKSIMHNADNPEHAAYQNPDHSDHTRVRAKVQALIKQASDAKKRA